jgi:predicted HTH domain antitoxin
MSTVTVPIPEAALALAGFEDQSVSEQASRLVALDLFREGRASLERAAELAGMSVEDFMEFSARWEVPLHYTAADLVEDRDTAARLRL